MKKLSLVCAAAAFAASASAPAFAGGLAAPVIEAAPVVQEAPASSIGSLGGMGAGAVILGLVLVGAAVAASSGT